MDSADGEIEHKHSMLFLYSLLLRGNTKGTALGLGGECCVPRWMAWQIAFITLLYRLGKNYGYKFKGSGTRQT